MVASVAKKTVLALGLSLFLFSCGENSGLGSSVDTEAPKLSIEYPPSAAAIRDEFTLYGLCSDDKAVKRVVVTLKNLETSAEWGPYHAAVTNSASWQIDLNKYDASNEEYTNGWQYPDGKYEATVVAYDGAGHSSGELARQFEIDNSAPVFIISNPNVVKSDGLSAATYGSVFTIDGTISDSHSITYMDVKIYDSTGTLVSAESYEDSDLDFYREEDIATAGGSSVTIAQYQTDETAATTTANTRYAQLHPNSSGTEYYYASITLTDSAKAYKNPTGAE